MGRWLSRPVGHGPAGWWLGLALALCGPGPARAGDTDEFSDKFLMLATGPVGGAFRPIGESLCDLVNEERRQTLIRCVPVGTAGSIFNLHALINGTVQLGIAQEDLVAQLYADRRQPRARALRAVAVLHTSPIAVMVRREAGVQALPGIASRVVNLGNRGSGQSAIVAALLRALQLRPEQLAGSTTLATSEFERVFCEGRVDVVVEAVAHPSAMFDKLRQCGGEFLDIPPEVVARMVAENPLLSPMQIPAGTYPGQDRAVSTLGMRNLLVAHASLGEESVRRLTQALRQRQAELLRGQALLASMAPVDAGLKANLPVPLHPGAARALRQGGAFGPVWGDRP